MADKRLRHFLHITGFLIVFICLLFTTETIFFDRSEIPYSWHQVQEGEYIDILVLGNSHAYMSTDTLLFSSVTGMNVQLFSSSNQNMEETLIHLEQALKYNPPQYIFLEVNSACLANRESLQRDNRGVILTDMDGITNPIEKFSAITKIFKWENVPEGMFQLFRPINMWERWQFDEHSDKEEIFHGYRGITTGSSYANGNIDLQEIAERARNNTTIGAVAPYNEKSLRTFLDLTAEHGITLGLYKAPTLNDNINEPVNAVFDIAKNYDNVASCINYQKQLDQMNLTVQDFADQRHLNRTGGPKFTKWFIQDMSECLGFGVNWENAAGYKSESITKTDNDQYIYSMTNYDENTLYKFQLVKGHERILMQNYSNNNSFVCDVDIRDNADYRVYCSMIPAECADEGDTCPKVIMLQFMMPNDIVIE